MGNSIVVRALHAIQGDNVDIYAFFIKGSDISIFADISRVSREDGGVLKGFQRQEIKSHVNSIHDYLKNSNALFPNAIILALSSTVKFSASRGTRPQNDVGVSQIGTLTIPVFEAGKRVAWIVDGQQRSLALSKSKDIDVVVPVIAFVSDSINTQREQFILVNKAKPLPSRLINELLPETEGLNLPRELNTKKIPSAMCNYLNSDEKSPFYKLIKRPSGLSEGVITDSAVITMIKNSIANPLGALSPYSSSNSDVVELAEMYRILLCFWNAVKIVFPDAWGKDPTASRLMHSAGIIAMGTLMDRICAKFMPNLISTDLLIGELNIVKEYCRWTSGYWPLINIKWNEFQNTPKDIKRLQETLVKYYVMSPIR